MIRGLIFILLIILNVDAYAQSDTSRMYSWNPDLDVILLLSSTSLNAYFLLEEPNGKRFISLDQIRSVSRDEISTFDVSATYNWNEQASSWSDVVQLSAMASPLLLMTSDKVRNEKWTIALMGLETMALNQGITGVLKLNTGRKRPYVYNEEAPDEIKYRRQVFYSFPSAHTSASAAATFFGASVFSHYYPHSKYKPLVWGAAITFPALTGYLRYEGGRHFPTDVIGGYLIGACIGVLIPKLHRIGGENFSIGTFGINDAVGLSFGFNLN